MRSAGHRILVKRLQQWVDQIQNLGGAQHDTCLEVRRLAQALSKPCIANKCEAPQALVRAVGDTVMALVLDDVRSIRVNADIGDLLALVPVASATGETCSVLHVAYAHADCALEQTCALMSAWTQVASPDIQKAVLLQIHAPGDFNAKSPAWVTWRANVRPSCRVSYWDVWDPQLAAGQKRFIVWVGA